jgi:hypothetical protein
VQESKGERISGGKASDSGDWGSRHEPALLVHLGERCSAVKCNVKHTTRAHGGDDGVELHQGGEGRGRRCGGSEGEGGGEDLNKQLLGA